MIVQPERIQQVAAAAVVVIVRPERIQRQDKVHVQVVAAIITLERKPAVVRHVRAVSM